jgi:diphthamide synthase (EF-2-diphthine--ammonia ligase)
VNVLANQKPNLPDREGDGLCTTERSCTRAEVLCTKGGPENKMKNEKAFENAAVCYARVSTEEQVRGGVSLEAQEERLRSYCRAAGLEVVQFVLEPGVSGSKA